ncbi:hypothetical protein ACVFYP_22340 [Roseomonas sp. F4]
MSGRARATVAIRTDAGERMVWAELSQLRGQWAVHPAFGWTALQPEAPWVLTLVSVGYKAPGCEGCSREILLRIADRFDAEVDTSGVTHHDLRGAFRPIGEALKVIRDEVLATERDPASAGARVIEFPRPSKTQDAKPGST